MTTTYILSRRLVAAKAALERMTLTEVSDQLFSRGSGYLFRILDTDRVQLRTVAKVANVLNARIEEIVEEVEEEIED